jgi:hypothetical protein
MGQLVRQHRLQLGRGQPPLDPGGHADHGVLLVAPGGEGVGQVGVGDGDPRLGHVGQGAEPVDHLVQLGRLLGRHLVPAHRRQGDPVGEEVLEEQEPAGDHDDEHPALQQDDEDGDKDHVQQAEQEHRAEHAARETGVGREPRSCHQIVTPG